MQSIPYHPSKFNSGSILDFMYDFDILARNLQPYYSKFDVANRLLFTGHSHQAWPDAAFEGMEEYGRMVATEVDKKWDHGFAKTEILRNYLRKYYDDPNGKYCREQNTHVLLVSWLSSLDLKNKPKILTTTGEFHSMYRQLRSLREIGIEVVQMDHKNDDQLLESFKENLDERTSAVMLSRIYFETSEINTQLKQIAKQASSFGVPVLVDDYHGTNVVPLSLKDEELEEIYILIGGYKYLQWGEANCFLRYPSNCSLRPVITGWFAAFQQLDHPKDDEPISFDDGDQKFATGTYDPISQFRAAAVTQFFNKMNLTPGLLRNQYSSQIKYLRDLFDEHNFEESGIVHANPRPIDETGGFMALQSNDARHLREELLKDGIFTDARDKILRIGPAPYTSKEQCALIIRHLFQKLTEIKQGNNRKRE